MNWRGIGKYLPDYGNYVGYRARCKSIDEAINTGSCPVPIDEYDVAGQIHDGDLNDGEFLKRIVKVPVNGFKRPVYGNIHRAVTVLVFGSIVGIKKIGSLL